MNKIVLIISREYLTRIQKKSFWIASILTPLLITAIYAIPIWLSTRDAEMKKIQILDQSTYFQKEDLQANSIQFDLLQKGDVNQLKAKLSSSDYDALVIIPSDILTNPKGLRMYSEKTLSITLQSDIENKIQDKIRQVLMKNAGIEGKIYESTQVNVQSDTLTLSTNGGETNSNSGGVMILAGILGFLLYFTVLIYGSQVMNGVIEEKSSRIIEVIVSSVKPYQLMLGKIIGVGLVGLTQFALWIALTFAFSGIATTIYGDKFKDKIEQNAKSKLSTDAQKEVNNAQENADFEPMKVVNEVVQSTNIPLILGSFLFFYLFGYLLYSSLFAAIGSAVETAAEAQQFTLPVTLPIIVSFLFAQFTIQDPDSTIAFWASIIPFTSPINMMVRLPYGVPTWELILSMVLLILGFLGTSWVSSRIYRVGILMYGKKMTWKEIGKWIFYKI
ncbi:ABC transporter permease [Aquirufa sp. ROCK2-A2]